MKEYLLELDEDIKFDEENEDKLIGYAERFGSSFTLLYEGVNTFLISDPDEAMDKAESLSSRVCFSRFEKSIVGYVILDDDRVALLHDKEVLLENLEKEYEKEYEKDGMEIDEDDSYYSQAIQ